MRPWLLNYMGDLDNFVYDTNEYLINDGKNNSISEEIVAFERNAIEPTSINILNDD